MSARCTIRRISVSDFFRAKLLHLPFRIIRFLSHCKFLFDSNYSSRPFPEHVHHHVWLKVLGNSSTGIGTCVSLLFLALFTIDSLGEYFDNSSPMLPPQLSRPFENIQESTSSLNNTTQPKLTPRPCRPTCSNARLLRTTTLHHSSVSAQQFVRPFLSGSVSRFVIHIKSHQSLFQVSLFWPTVLFFRGIVSKSFQWS